MSDEISRAGAAAAPMGGGSPARGRAAAAFLVRRIGLAIRRIAGMPDYAAYVDHVRRCHPGRPVPTEREFFDQYLRARYADGPTRCC